MRYWINLLLIAYTFLLPGNVVFGQEPFFRQIQIAGTSSNLRINAICQDSSKFIWLATNEGLWKNDGVSFHKVKLPPAFSESSISAVHPLPGGGIIAGNVNGKLFTVFNEKVTEVSTAPFRVMVPVSSICVVGPGEFWFSTFGEGVYHLNESRVEHYTVSQGLGDDYVYKILLDKNGRIWTGSDGGLSFSDLNKNGIAFSNLTTKDGLPDNIIRQIESGPRNTLGIGMEEKGFCVYDLQQNRFDFTEEFMDWSFGPVTSMVKLDNEFWIGTQKSGIVDFEFQAERRIRHFAQGVGFEGTNVNAILKDHEGNIWIGAGNELYFSPGEKIEFKRTLSGVTLTNIHTILVDHKDNIWFSNDSGVYVYTKNFREGFKLTMPVNGIVNNRFNVISLYEDSYGYIWMGTFDNGVLRYDPGTSQWRKFTESDGLINANILSIDGSGTEIWFATLGGVSKGVLNDSTFNGQVSFVSFSEQHGLGNNFMYKVFIDSRNRVWFATDGNGITCYDKGKFINYSVAQGLHSRIIYSLAEDRNGAIWLSSSDEGIFRFDGGSFRNISVAQGLSDLNVTSLAADMNGNIVVINKKGIDIINPDNLYILSFGNEIGISNIDPDVNVVDTDQRGNVWIGTSNGIIKLNVGQKIGEKRPVLRLNAVLCFLEKVDTSTTSVYAYDRNHISFDYTALWYADPLKAVYQYKLSGYNKEWITTRDRFVTFPNLRPGTYSFMLRTTINNNFTNSEVISYNFRIRSPFWQRPWFVFGLIGLVGLVLYFYIRYRDNLLKSRERLKKEKIESQYEILKNQVNPHFLFNSFNTLITVIETDPDIAIEYVNKLSDFFRSILSYREKDLIPVREELQLVETYIFLQQKRYGDNFKVEVNVSDTVKDRNLIPPLALQILIENCLKHNSVSRETKLKVEIFTDENNYLVVRNNINPKFTKEPSTGIGLQNLRNRYQLISNTQIFIDDTGGYFTVKLPTIKPN